MNPEKNRRMTFQRKIILQELSKMKSHPSADELFTRIRSIIPHISLATVYRNLDVLVDSGQIKMIDIAGNQKRFDGTVDKHHHVFCSVCKRIDDVPRGAVKKVKIVEKKLEDYHILSHELVLIGICKDCYAQTQSESGSGDDDNR